MGQIFSLKSFRAKNNPSRPFTRDLECKENGGTQSRVLTKFPLIDSSVGFYEDLLQGKDIVYMRKEKLSSDFRNMARRSHICAKCIAVARLRIHDNVAALF